MNKTLHAVSRRVLGRVSRDTLGAGGSDIEMAGLWHKPGLTR